VESEWVVKRLALWQSLREPDQPSDTKLAQRLGMSRSWVQKWRARLVGVAGDDSMPFLSRPRCRHTSPKQVGEEVEATILHLREQLTEQYQRRVGARNILYHLHRDPDLKRLGVFIPRSPTTVHQVLLRYHCVPRPAPRQHLPLEPADPLQVWEIDFTDVVTAQSPESEKRRHQVELFDVLDTGTSIALETKVSDQFDAKHALIAVIDAFRSAGLPGALRFDRDPRFVASWSVDEFPSAFMRFLLCVGVTPAVCPPRRPDRKPYVERFIRTQKEECLYPKRPTTVAQTQLLIDQHRRFYNLERPNQALTCQNQPPSLALTDLPSLPRLPKVVNPDAWLAHYDRQGFKRRVRSNGSVSVDNDCYYVGKRHAGQQALLVLNAAEGQFEVLLGQELLKVYPLRHLFHGQLPLDEYVDLMVQAAESEEKRLNRQRLHRQRVA